jgi:hypothetical protein
MKRAAYLMSAFAALAFGTAVANAQTPDAAAASCGSRRPSGHTNCPLDGCDSDRRRSRRQAVGRRHVHQHQGQGSRRRGQAPDQQQRAWIWCSMLSAARCSSRRSNRSASAEGRWRSRASAAGASNSIRSISYYDLKRLIGVDSMKFS